MTTLAATRSPTVSNFERQEFAIATDGLTKRFGDTAVVDDLGLEVPRGSVFGFLGPNGSGKTTTIRMLLGLISPSAGSVELFGRPMPYSAQAVVVPHADRERRNTPPRPPAEQEQPIELGEDAVAEFLMDLDLDDEKG